MTTAEAGTSDYYGNYISEKVLEKYGATLSAADVLHDHYDLLDDPQGKAVIIGAHWHLGGYGEGEEVDAHDTPVGVINGAMIHADFAEAILDSRIFGHVPPWVLIFTEIVFSVAAAIVFALVTSPSIKLAAFIGITVFLLFVQWLMLIAIGTFFEAFIPIAGLWIHSFAERFAGHEH